MRKLIILGVFAIVGWTSYYDVTKGTLTFLGSELPTQHISTVNTGVNYKTVHIQPGDTVLSIYEKLNPTSEVAIQKVITEFSTLNKGVDPNHIQIGKDYKFPLYSAQRQE